VQTKRKGTVHHGETIKIVKRLVNTTSAIRKNRVATPSGRTRRHTVSEDRAQIRVLEVDRVKKLRIIGRTSTIPANSAINAAAAWAIGYVGTDAARLHDDFIGGAVACIDVPAHFSRAGRVDHVDRVVADVGGQGKVSADGQLFSLGKARVQLPRCDGSKRRCRLASRCAFQHVLGPFGAEIGVPSKPRRSAVANAVRFRWRSSRYSARNSGTLLREIQGH